MRHSEADRKAYQEYCERAEKALAIQNWLQANPRIGELNGGKYYIIVNGDQVDVKALSSLEGLI